MSQEQLTELLDNIEHDYIGSTEDLNIEVFFIQQLAQIEVENNLCFI